jgi:hypothetical protein
MKKYFSLLTTFCLSTLLCSGTNISQASEQGHLLAKYEPPQGRVLVFVGQDNKSVGGTDKWSDGYVDHIGMPAGITHYVYFTEGHTNEFGFTFDEGHVDGMLSETTWGAGPMCMDCYLSDEDFKGIVVHLSISMEFGSEDKIATGEYDHLILELADYLTKYQHMPFLIRIGYEFDGSWNDYDPENFKLAWRRIVDGLRERNVDNFATVMASSRRHLPIETWETYWPGDNYVDWIGYSYWANETPHPLALDFARAKNKPVFIAETTPRGFFLNMLQDGQVWNDWFQILLDHIEENDDVIKAVSYINTHWDADPMWSGWGDSRIETNAKVKQKWLETMQQERYIHQTEGTYDLIGFVR